jgi:hypothetical protein
MPWIFGPEFASHPGAVEMKELKTMNEVERAAAFKARMGSFFFKQVDCFASSPPWAPFPLALMTCVGIETIGAYKYGDARNDRNRHFRLLVEEMNKGFARTETDPDGQLSTLSTFLYKGFRNSLAHGFYGKWVFITHDPQKAKTFRFSAAERFVVLNVYWFYARFRWVAQRYLDHLTAANDPTQDPLATFGRTFVSNYRTWL